MKLVSKDLFSATRPGFKMRGNDLFYCRLADELAQTALKSMNTDEDLDLEPYEAMLIGMSLSGYVEDLATDLGIWSALLQHHAACYGPDYQVPFFPEVPEDTELESEPSIYAVSYLLWGLLRILRPGLIVPPHSPFHIIIPADDCMRVIDRYWMQAPSNDYLADFLLDENRSYQSLKDRLLWLHTNSYLFGPRHHSQMLHRPEQQMAGRPQDQMSELMELDRDAHDTPSIWSAVTALQLLPHIIDADEADTQMLLNWAPLRTSLYQSEGWEDASHTRLRFRPVLGLPPCIVQFEPDDPAPSPHMTAPGTYCLGSLVPWKQGWHFSGPFQAFSERDIPDAANKLHQLALEMQQGAFALMPDLLEHTRGIIRGQEPLAMELTGGRGWMLTQEPMDLTRLSAAQPDEHAEPVICPAHALLFFIPDAGWAFFIEGKRLLEILDKRGQHITEAERALFFRFLQSSDHLDVILGMLERAGHSMETVGYVLSCDIKCPEDLQALIRAYSPESFLPRHPMVKLSRSTVEQVLSGRS